MEHRIDVGALEPRPHHSCGDWDPEWMPGILGDLWDVRGKTPGRNLDRWLRGWWCLSPKRGSEDSDQVQRSR